MGKAEEDRSNGIWVHEINEETAIEFEKQLFRTYEAEPTKPIMININSYGGEVHALFGMLDAMNALRELASEDFSIITFARGKAMSAAAVLLACGDFRFAAKNTSIMLHQIIGGTWGSQAENTIQFTELERLNSNLISILRERCKIEKSNEEFIKDMSHDLFLTPVEAVKFGLIDMVGYPILCERTVYEMCILDSQEVKKSVRSRKTNRKTPKDKN